jgi:hypothetical protein
MGANGPFCNAEPALYCRWPEAGLCGTRISKACGNMNSSSAINPSGKASHRIQSRLRHLPVSSNWRISNELTGCFAGVNEDPQTGFDVIANLPEGISMMKSSAIKRIMLGASVMAMVAGSIPLAVAQDASGVVSAQPGVASGAKPTKAQRKEARNEARAKKNAELKKLEDAGYRPATNDPNYPTDLQKAEKKAGIGAAASQ